MCELCAPDSVLVENELAYAQSEKKLVKSRARYRGAATACCGLLEMTNLEQIAVVELLNNARVLIHSRHSPDGYNIGVNIGPAAGQSRMHVHVHLIPPRGRWFSTKSRNQTEAGSWRISMNCVFNRLWSHPRWAQPRVQPDCYRQRFAPA